MPVQVTKIQVFVASPGDVDRERELLEAVILELNNTFAAHLYLVLELVKYETHTHPGMGVDPQDVVNQQIEPTDIFIGIMWKRFGTKTERAESGTVEEFKRARDRCKSNPDMHIMFYFNETPFYPQTRQETTQAGNVLAFKKSLGKTALTCKYTGVQEFEKQVRQHLTRLLLTWHKKHGTPIVSAQDAPTGQHAVAVPAQATETATSSFPGPAQLGREDTSAVRTVLPQGQSKSPRHTIELLLSKDPAESIPAAQRLMEAAEPDLPRVLVNIKSRLSVSQEFSVRLLLGKFAQQSAPLMIEKVLNAASDWAGALATADLFTPAHRPYAADLLASKLTSQVHFDIGRMCIESLGYMGADRWSHKLLESIFAKGDPHGLYFDEYTYDKQYSYVIEALARMFVLSQDNSYGEPPIFDLEEGLIFIEKQGSLRKNPLLKPAVATILGEGTPAHGDMLLRRWIKSDKPYLRELAVFAVGFMRFSRATQALKEIVLDASRDEFVSKQALLALSNIRTPASIESVIAAFEERPQILSALAASRCLEAVEDDDTFCRLCKKLLEFDVLEKCWVYRACGLRNATEFLEPILAALHSAEESDRAHAALALARFDATQHRSLLLRVHEKAVNHMDKIMSGLALLLDTEQPYANVIEELRMELPKESWMYQRQTREDIVNVLIQHKSQEAQLLGSSWKQIYAGSQDY
jgi:hypothetical protein